MKRFFCCCGQEIFFENSSCLSCGRRLAYAPSKGRMVSLDARADERWCEPSTGDEYTFCDNRVRYAVCNSIVDIDDPHALCLACRLNRTIPNLSHRDNLHRWYRIEQAKRRLIFGLLSLGLPLEAAAADYPRGLSFDFLEDRRSNAAVPEEFVTTGHRDGVITLNILEADDVQREWQRQQSSERYRTVLGHFRHEAGHYYYELLVREHSEFVLLFGDPAITYEAALKRYYDCGPAPHWEQRYISAYASAHPLEDWAECFAHYLHSVDTLETAVDRGLIAPAADGNNFDQVLGQWDGFAVTLNELNRSLGLQDAYPFVVTPVIAEKLRYVHQRILAVRGAVTG